MVALLLGGGLQALSTANSLKRIGWCVNVFSKESMFKYCSSIEHIVYFQLSVEVIVDYINTNDISIVIPMSDKHTQWLCANRIRIENQTNAKCAIPPSKVLSIVGNKSVFLKFCRNNDIPSPETESITMKNVLEISEKIGFPSLIKPDFSVGAQGITKVFSIEELLKKLPTVLDRYGTCSLQEFVDNKEFYYNVMLYRYSNGTYAQDVITRIFRFFPKSGGSSCCCVTVEDSKLIEVCKRTLDKLEWIGFADFDVLYDTNKGQYKIIEINPRVPASLRAADISGVNFPQIMVEDILLNKKVEMIYTPGYYLRYFGLDCMWFLSSLRDLSVSVNWFRFFGKNLCYQDLYLDSPFLIIGIMTHGVKRLFQKFSKKN